MYPAVGAGFVILIEMTRPHCVAAALGRNFLTILQGTQWLVTGFVVNSPFSGMFAKWDLHKHDNVMIATTLFVVAAGASWVLVMLLALVSHYKVKIEQSGNAAQLKSKRGNEYGRDSISTAKLIDRNEDDNDGSDNGRTGCCHCA